MTYKLLALICFFGFNSLLTHAQAILNGRVLSKNGLGIIQSSVIAIGNQTQQIAFTITDKDGFFTLKVPLKTDVHKLHVSNIQYEPKVLEIDSTTSFPINIYLEQRINKLPEVKVVSTPPLKQRGDTLSYAVDYFKNQNDRVLKDVLAKLPGITVTSNGSILYQNKAINKFYIDGNDILSDRYNIASNNLPIDAVDNIQVLENHQPVKMLNGIINSNQASINIKMSKSAPKILGREIAMWGYNPTLLSNNQLSLFMLSGKHKFVSTFKHNNIGLDFSNEMNSLNTKLDIDDLTKNLVSLNEIQRPNIARYRFVFNQEYSQTNSTSFKLGNATTLKLFTGFANVEEKMTATQTATYFYPADTFSIFQKSYNKKNAQNYFFTATATKNSNNCYAKNTTSVKLLNEKGIGQDSGTNNAFQHIKVPLIKVMNDFEGIKKIKGKYYTISSNTYFKLQNQSLSVSPGVYKNIINTGIPYNLIIQDANMKSFNSNNYIGFLLPLSKSLKVAINAGENFDIKVLHTYISKMDSLNLQKLGYPFINEIYWRNLKSYLELKHEISWKKIVVDLKGNMSYNLIKYDTGNHIDGVKTNGVLTSFDITARYSLTPKWTFSSSLSSDKSYNDLTEMRNGYFLEQYTSLSRTTNIQLTKYKTLRASVGFEYKNVLKILFWNFNMSKDIIFSNFLYNSFLKQGFFIRDAKMVNNRKTSNSVNTNISKFLSRSKVNAKMGVQLTQTLYTTYQNDVLRDFSNTVLSWTGSAIKEVDKSFSISYNAKYSKSSNRQLNTTAKALKVITINQTMQIDKTFKFFAIGSTLEHYFNSYPQSKMMFFADLRISKKLNKMPVDLAIEILNLLNQRHFYITDFYGNNIINSTYNLRPFCIMGGVKFNL